MREATPVAIKVDGSATGASESTMACESGLVEPAPFRQATIKISPRLKHFRDSRQPLHPHSCSYTLRRFPPQPNLCIVTCFVDLRKLYDLVVVEDGGASTSLSSSKDDNAIKHIVVIKL